VKLNFFANNNKLVFFNSEDSQNVNSSGAYLSMIGPTGGNPPDTSKYGAGVFEFSWASLDKRSEVGKGEGFFRDVPDIRPDNPAFF
jgi:hypothetical protein